MMTLILGGSGSGKSAYAEDYLLRAAGDKNKYYIATKLSNFSPDTWSREASIAMYNNSLKELQVDYLDYMLLHGIGMGGMEAYENRYVKNGILDFLLEERKAGNVNRC